VSRREFEELQSEYEQLKLEHEELAGQLQLQEEIIEVCGGLALDLSSQTVGPEEESRAPRLRGSRSSTGLQGEGRQRGGRPCWQESCEGCCGCCSCGDRKKENQ
jgi:hypothetical protein